jgi:Flp pilus assembly pilin Flp
MTTLMVSVLAFVSGIKDRLASEKGATATEYSLLVAFIAFIIVAGVTTPSATRLSALVRGARADHGRSLVQLATTKSVSQPLRNKCRAAFYQLNAAHAPIPNPAVPIRGGVQ